ncbi:MAG: hypothetical protein K9G13_03675 [Aquiluna sp.]|nr:hypothetical protein [Aquiluna sp.]MCF8545619.1 hypothetical protein [Aquiluna sp.]
MSFVLPENDNDVTILGIMASMEISAAKEFSDFLNNHFSAAGKPDWFEDVRFYRRSLGAPFNYSSANDLRFVLNEATQQDSQIWHLIPNMNEIWVNAADNLRRKLNQLHHQQLKPDLNTLYQISSLFQQVTEDPGLEVAGWARAVSSRVKSILAGTFQQPEVPSPEPEMPAAVKEIEREYESVKKEFEKRPPWGAKWPGEKPKRKLNLDSHTQDIYDENGLSVKHELGELGDQVTSMWLRYFPRGGEVWVDEDGATMAYVKGTQTMVGWFGPAPDEDKDNVRGFVLPREYVFTGADIQDIGSKLMLSNNAEEPIKEHLALLSKKITEGTKLNITDYGDLFIPVNEGDPIRITRMHKGIWFPGQLPG